MVPSKKLYRLGNHVRESLARTVIKFTIDERGNSLEYQTDVLDVDIPRLFGLDMMKKLVWYTNEVTDKFIGSEKPEMRSKLKFKKGRLCLEWPSNVILFSRTDLLRIRRQFVHPTAGNLLNY